MVTFATRGVVVEPSARVRAGRVALDCAALVTTTGVSTGSLSRVVALGSTSHPLCVQRPGCLPPYSHTAAITVRRLFSVRSVLAQPFVFRQRVHSRYETFYLLALDSLG